MKYYFSLFLIVYLLDQQLRFVEGRVRYVNVNGGDDTGDCTQNMPCETLHYGVFGENFTSDRDYFNCNVSAKVADNSTIMVEDGEYRMDGFGLVLCEVYNITIRAVNPRGAVVQCDCFNCSIQDAMFGNIYIQRARDITFEGLVFEKCGYNASNVFVRSTVGLTFRNCVFRNNVGSPLQLRFSTDVLLEDTIFQDNHNLFPATADTNSTNITELYRAIITGGGITYYSNDTAELEIRNCVFINNSANVNDVNNSRPVLLKTNGHGGAIIFRLSGSSNSSIIIRDTCFHSNYAQVDGGAIYFSFSDKAMNNSVILEGINFTNNTVDQASGGAVSINSFSISYLTKVVVTDCLFINNSGNAGGAFSAVLYDSNEESATRQDTINFTDCHFINNNASNEGTAVGLFSLVHVDQVGYPVSFTDCIFDNNYSDEANGDTSALAAFRFPVTFRGVNNFTNNAGGGITLLNTRMDAHNAMNFINNTAVFGGGIAMDDRCLLNLYNGTEILFERNSASESGGAIYVDFPPIRFVIDIFNRLCFMQYFNNGNDVPPQNWTDVKVSFINNTARLSGAAIYASDLRRCSWLGNNFTNDTSLIFLPPPELSNHTPFSFIGNTLMQEGVSSNPNNIELATSPSRIDPNLNNLIEHRVQPGETVSISLLARDQLGNSREAVWSLEAPGQEANLGALSANMDNYNYIVRPVVDLCEGQEQPNCNPPVLSFDNNITVNLSFSLLRTLGEVSTVSLYVLGCLPGYVTNTDNTVNATCDCDTSNDDIVRCDDSRRYLYLREGVWGDMNGGTGRLESYQVFSAFVNCTQQGRLPGCEYRFDDPDAQCINGRKGKLCGTCIDEYGVTLDLQSCQEDCTRGIVLFVIVCFLVVAVSIAILLVDFELPAELKGFIFYAQVIGLVYRPYITIQDPGSNGNFFSIVVNLLGFSLPIPYCLSHSLEAHQIALLGYISPVLGLSVVLIYTILARRLRYLGEHGALRGIGFMGLFIYKYIADTSFVMISCVDAGGFVFQYDGAKKCTDADFMPFYVIGMLLVVLFVFPAPFAVGYICARRPKQFQHFADVLTVGLKTERLWYGGWDLGRRLPFVFISFFTVLARPSLILFFMSLAALVVLGVHCFAKPYKDSHVNAIEAGMLLNLLLVTGAFLDPTGNQVPIGFSLFLVMIPFAYAALFLVWKICVRLKIIDKLKEYKPSFLNWNDTPSPENDNQVPMVVENNVIKADSDKKVTPDSGSDGASGSGQDSIPNRENTGPRVSTDTDPNKRALEESDFTRPQEELIFIN